MKKPKDWSENRQFSAVFLKITEAAGGSLILKIFKELELKVL
jgi:hypothetical protein